MSTTETGGGRLVVVMPAYNEAACIAGFLDDLHRSLLEWSPSFVVVDDDSSDDTEEVVNRVATNGIDVTVVRNAQNLGHGPSTLRALRLGLADGPDRVLALDGDGQYVTADLVNAVRTSFCGGNDIVEGVRVTRNSPLYRRAVSGATRLLVWSACRTLPADANTPVRVYRPAVLEGLLDTVGPRAAVPNLFVSALSRRGGLQIEEVTVGTTDREGSDPAGTTWRARWASIPSRRFLTFCSTAIAEWWRFRRSMPSSGR